MKILIHFIRMATIMVVSRLQGAEAHKSTLEDMADYSEDYRELDCW